MGQQQLISWEQLSKLVPVIPKGAEVFVSYFNTFMPQYGIDTSERIAMFLAQLAHESGGFKYVRELWGPTSQQLKYERDFNSAWPPTAEDNKNKVAFALGNANAGDGKFFRGRAFIQCTGRNNYHSFSVYKGDPEMFTKNPELLEAPSYNIEYCCWFWQTHNLNKSADARDLHANTLIINGGLTGFDNRQKCYDRAKDVLMLS